MRVFDRTFLLAACAAAMVPVPQHWPSAAAQRAEPAVLISALHYFGRDGSNDEGVELANVSPAPVALDGTWLLRDGNQRAWRFPELAIPPGGRVWLANNALAFSQQFGFSPTLSYAGALSFANQGGAVSLQRSAPSVLDTANASGGAWPAGAAGPSFRSMERIDAGQPDTASNWADASPAVAVAFDGNGAPIQGTPRAANSMSAPVPAAPAAVVINEVAWAGTAASSSHEWIELYNGQDSPVLLSGWELRVAGTTVVLSGTIDARGFFLIQRSAATFSAGAVADQTASFSLSNAGAALQLINPNAEVIDALVYGDGRPGAGWIGPPLQPYTVTQAIPDEGQILMRRLDPASGLPVADTDSAEDWMNHRGDVLSARRPAYPGWRLDQFTVPATDAGLLMLAAAPDASYALASQVLYAATTSIDLAAFTFEHATLGDLLAAKASQGVRVRVLLDGAPVGGLKDQTRWICARITSADPTGRSGCWFMRGNPASKIFARYAFMHAKYVIVDDTRLLIGSENFGPRGMPNDDPADGTAGQRGVVAAIDAPRLVARVQAIFTADIDAGNRDITRWCAGCPTYGSPAATFVPDYASGGISYTVRHQTMIATGAPSMTLYSSPENHLGAGSGVLALVGAAGPGDEILVQQLDEPPYWGPVASSAAVDPNPRLQALLDAAARGARVRILLDGYYDDAASLRSNRATARYVTQLAQANGWDIQAVLGNPTGLGIHNKLFLIQFGNRRLAHIGSWNGTEISAKRDRELSVLIESAEAHAYLRDVFMRDFHVSQPLALPVMVHQHRPAQQPLISEVMYNPKGANEEGREWVELFNPTSRPFALAGYKIGDAVLAGSLGEGMFAFPVDAVLAPNDAIVIAQNSAAFFADWGTKPDYELANYDNAVRDLIPYSNWATGNMNLANLGDEVVLLNNDDRMSDVVAWLNGSAPGTAICQAAVAPGHSLQRWPPSSDTDSCAVDFRDQAIPSPGTIP